jgi:hypothetical protein
MGSLLPRERDETLTRQAGAEPVVGAHQVAVQRLQFFGSASRWDAEKFDVRRLELLLADAHTVRPRLCRRPTWPRSCAATGYATGSSRATNRLNTNRAGPASRSVA